MDTFSLVTRYDLPAVRTQRVVRRRLHARLDPILERMLAVVRAPAGCGKTTLVADWLAHLAQRRDVVVPQVAWLTLDASDNDPRRFAADLVGSIEQAYPSTGSTLRAVLGAGDALALEPTLVALIHRIAANPRECVWVLDDYHLIAQRAIHDAVDTMIDHLPPQLHLVLCTRTDPPLALDRLRVRDQLVTVDQDHLAWRVEETDAFMRDVMGVDLSEAQVAALTARTEGWIAGLQLAALSLREVDASARGRLVDRYSGSQRDVAGYLLHEAFAAQPPALQTLLLRTSLVDRFCAPLCDALVGDAGIPSGATLGRIEAAGLFVTALDAEGRWYRYHPLFRDFLRDLLAEQTPEALPELHLRASRWHTGQGRADEAIEHALAGGAIERAAELIDEGGYRLAQESAPTRLLGWIDRIPRALHREHPWVRVAQLEALCATERYDELAPLLETLDADTALYPGEPIAAVVELIRAWTVMRTRYEPATLLRLGLETRAQLADQPDTANTRLMRSMAALYIGHGHWNTGDRAAAQEAFEASLRLARACRSTPAILRALLQLALFYQASGPLSRCADVCQEGIALAERAWREQASPAPPAELVAHLEGLLALMLLLWRRIKEATVHARRAVELFDLGGARPGNRIEHGLLVLAGVHCARGDHPKAYDILRRIDRELASADPHVVWQVRPKTVRLRIGLSHVRPQWQGLLRDVEAWVSQARLDADHPERNALRAYEAYGCGLMALGRSAEAVPWLQRGLEKVRAQGWVLGEMLFAMWLAMALQQADRPSQAEATMAQALATAETEGCVSIFGEVGPEGVALIRRIRLGMDRHRERYGALTAPFVDAALEAASEAIPSGALARAATPAMQPIAESASRLLIEPLSERETEVLQLVAQGLRNHQVAAELYVTANTVNFHLKNIYGKLNVHSRTEAVSAARELAILA